MLGGIQIDGYYELNMSEIPKLNSMVDGVTVTLEDDFSKKYPKMKKGATINLDDEQAYASFMTVMELGMKRIHHE